MVMKLISLAALAFVICTATSLVWSVAPVEVVGLFKNRAVVRVPGAEVMIKVGETKEGVTLLAANATQAQVRYQGQEYTLSLSNRVAGNFQPAQTTQVAISSDELGQYRIRGAVNNRFTSFLVDTGASVVAISSTQATGLGIDFSNGTKGVVHTAQGKVDSHFVTLDKVVVGGITAYNVQAAVIDGNYPLDPLLGMSFLRHVRMQEHLGVLTLTQQN
jgi:aspartyl protease family protein